MSNTNWKKAVGTVVNGFFIKDCKRVDKRTLLYVTCPFCHKDKWVRSDHVKAGAVISCGCYSKDNNFIKPKNIEGLYFGRLKAIKPIGKDKYNGSITWECMCKCGKTVFVSAGELLGGKRVSCGCGKSEAAFKRVDATIGKYNKTVCVDGTKIDKITREKPIASNTSGYTGVKWDKERCRWKAEIEFKGKKYYLGRYENKKDAITARKTAEQKLFGNFMEWYTEIYSRNKEKKE